MADESAAAAELEERIRDLFADADLDGSGSLSITELRVLLNRLDVSLGLKLSGAQTRKLLSAADADDDGSVSYAEFVPVATRIIAEDKERRAQRAEDAKSAAKIFLVHGLSRDELNAQLRAHFDQADADHTGYLGRKQFRAAMAACGLSKEEANYMMSEGEMDADGNGYIDYNEFLPKGFDLLAQLVADRMMVLYQNEEQTRHFLFELLSQTDTEGTGNIPIDVVRSTLADADLGFSGAQIGEIVARCAVEGGTCDYKASIPAMTGSVLAMLNGEGEGEGEEPADGFEAMTTASKLSAAARMSREEIEAAITAELEPAGPGGTVSASLYLAAVTNAARRAAVELTAAEAARVAGEAEGDVEWRSAMKGVFDALVACARDRVV